MRKASAETASQVFRMHSLCGLTLRGYPRHSPAAEAAAAGAPGIPDDSYVLRNLPVSVSAGPGSARPSPAPGSPERVKPDYDIREMDREERMDFPSRRSHLGAAPSRIPEGKKGTAADPDRVRYQERERRVPPQTSACEKPCGTDRLPGMQSRILCPAGINLFLRG